MLAAKILPRLTEKVQALAYAAARLPLAASREMALAIQHDMKRQVDPYGTPHAPVVALRARERGVDADVMRRFDPSNHVRDSWYPVVRGTDAIVASDHRAAAALQPKHPRGGRKRRLMHPVSEQGLGTWGKRIERMHRRLVRGAEMGAEVRAQLKAAAEQRRAARLARRNAERALLGLPPVRQRKTRSDRRRIDALVVRAI